MGIATRPRRSRQARGPALLVATIVAAMALLAPASPAAADPVASTVALSTYDTASQLDGIRIFVVIQAAGPTPTGVVVLSEGPTELARADLAGGTVLMVVPAAVGPHTVTVTYLGSADTQGSTASRTITIVPAAAPYPLTGTMTTLAGTSAIPDGSTLVQGNGDVYDPLTGYITAGGRFLPSTATADLPGYGPVTVTYRPSWWGMFAGVLPNGTVGFSEMGVSLIVDLVTVGGTGWSAGSDCQSPPVGITFAGTAGPTGLSFAGTTSDPIPAFEPASCGGRAAIVDALLAGPLSFALHTPGDFTPPPPAGTATATTLAVSGPDLSVGSSATVQVTVTTATGHVPRGQVRILDGSTLLTTLALSDGTASDVVPLDTEGTRTLTASYAGYQSALTPSSGSATITVGPPPAGRPTTGHIDVGTNPSTIFPTGTRLTGADFDPVTGDISSGSFWFPAGMLEVDTGVIGNVQIKYRLHQTAPMTGHVAADGTVTFDPTSLMLEARSYSFDKVNFSPLSSCTFGPIPMALAGTADAGGLHLRVDDTLIPALPTTSCSGWAGLVNSRVAVATDLSFEVEGDFRRFAPSTPVDVATYFPAVAQYNQSYFVAHVGTGTDIPTGEVTFRDGATVLGTSPVDANGYASLVASMDQPGTRTITAAYDGDPLHGPGSDTTTVAVDPAPTGLPLDGNLTVSGNPLGIGAGSQLIPANGNSGAPLSGDLPSSRAALWFTPTTIPLDLPGYGPAQVEVRLFQYGQLSATTVGRDGKFSGLSGLFVLQVRKITTATGSTIPLGCINLVLLGLSGQLTYTDVDITSTAGGAGRIPLGICTGPGQAAITALAGGPVTATLHAPL